MSDGTTVQWATQSEGGVIYDLAQPIKMIAPSGYTVVLMDVDAGVQNDTEQTVVEDVSAPPNEYHTTTYVAYASREGSPPKHVPSGPPDQPGPLSCSYKFRSLCSHCDLRKIGHHRDGRRVWEKCISCAQDNKSELRGAGCLMDEGSPDIITQLFTRKFSEEFREEFLRERENCTDYEYASMVNIKNCCPMIENSLSISRQPLSTIFPSASEEERNKFIDLCNYAYSNFKEEIQSYKKAIRDSGNIDYFNEKKNKEINEKILQSYYDSIESVDINTDPITSDSITSDSITPDTITPDTINSDNIEELIDPPDFCIDGETQDGFEQPGCQITDKTKCISNTFKSCTKPKKGYTIINNDTDDMSGKIVIPCHKILKNIRDLNLIDHSISENLIDINQYCNNEIKGECNKIPGFCNDPNHNFTDCCMSTYKIKLLNIVDFFKKNLFISFMIIFIIIGIILYFVLASTEKQEKIKASLKKVTKIIPIR